MVQSFWLCFLISLFVLFPVLPAAGTENNQLKKPYHILQSASELDYPPFAVVQQNGSASGFSVELLRAVVAEVSLKIDFTVGPWHEIKDRLINGQLDVLPLVSFSAERDKLLDFSAPYLRMHGAIFVRTGETAIHGESRPKGQGSPGHAG